MKLFLDTNVFIDFIMERPQFYPAAAMIVSFAVDGKVEMAVSSLSMINANFIVVERCKMPKDMFRKKIDFLRDYMTICSVDISDVYYSYDAKWKDFEDGVQYSSAKRWNADYIVTRNVKDFEENEVSIISPENICQKIHKAF